MKVVARPEEFKLAGLVSPLAFLREISLLEVNVRNSLGVEASERPLGEPVVSIIEGVPIEIVAGKLTAKVGVKITFRYADDEGAASSDAAILEIVYGLVYGLPAEPVPPEIEKAAIPAFARLNATLNCWPYLRQQVDRLCSEMRIAYLLPLLKIEREEVDAGKAPEPNATKKTSARKKNPK